MRKYTTGQRIKQYMRENNLRQLDILNLTQKLQSELNITMSKAVLSHYVNDRSTPDEKRRHLLSLALGVTEPWLMGYESEEALSQSEHSLIGNYRKLKQPFKERINNQIRELITLQKKELVQPSRIKPAKVGNLERLYLEKTSGTTIYPDIIGAAAGEGTSHYADFNVDEIMIPTEQAYTDRNIIPMYVKGDSMEPKYYDGDVIWVDLNQKSIDLHQIGVFDTEFGRVVKKRGADELISLNPDYPDIELNEYMDFRTLGQVIDVTRGADLEIWKNAIWE